MSTYENYSIVARSYDQTRAPIGVAIILDFLGHNPIALRQQRLLDAGCGTGNYTFALSSELGHINAADANPKMLDRARLKLDGADNTEFHHARLQALPFGATSFDGVIVNQVLHHLDDGTDPSYPACREAFAEFARVMKPNAVLVVNTCSHDQLRRGFWPYALIPEARERMCRRHIPIPQLAETMNNLGFTLVGERPVIDPPLQGEAYFDEHGPFSPSWRNGDSIWSTVSDTELQAALAQLDELEKSHELDRFVATLDAQRQDVGQIMFLAFQKHQDTH